MDSGLLLYCNVSKNISSIRKKYDEHTSLPAHMTLCYLKQNYDEKKLINKLKKIKKIKINLDKLDIKDDLISLMANNTSIIDNIIKQIKKDVLKLPRSGFHLSLVYKRGSKKIKKSVIKKVTPLIKLPEVVEIDKIWLLKRNKSIGKDWYRSKTIFLK